MLPGGRPWAGFTICRAISTGQIYLRMQRACLVVENYLASKFCVGRCEFCYCGKQNGKDSHTRDIERDSVLTGIVPVCDAMPGCSCGGKQSMRRRWARLVRALNYLLTQRRVVPSLVAGGGITPRVRVRNVSEGFGRRQPPLAGNR